MRKRLENYFNRIWYSDKQANIFLRGLSRFFDSQRKRREIRIKKHIAFAPKLNVPVIVVGNISIGGTGKSPIVLFLIDALKRRTYTPGVISRGYGGKKSQQAIIVLDEKSEALDVGDEAFMIYQRSKVPFAVGNDRVAVAEALLKAHPEINVLISDDGLQHYRLQRDVELVVVDGERGFGNAGLLPAGPLREPLTRLQTVDRVLCNGQAKHDSLSAIDVIPFSLQASVFSKLNAPGETSDFNNFYGKTAEAFAGIGNPERFFKLLESMGLEVNRHYVEDHGVMPEEFFVKNKNKVILMTEKDAVKYPNVYATDCWYLPVNVTMSSDNKDNLLSMIASKIESS